jgi:hypothetical protein
VKYLAEMEYAASRLLVGVVTDCSCIKFYKEEACEFFRSPTMALLKSGDPTEGFKLLVRLFATSPDDLKLPVVETPVHRLEDFVGFPHKIAFHTKSLKFPRREVTITGVLGFGASSHVFCGNLFEKGVRYENVCIKVGQVPGRNDAEHRPRALVNQITQEIEMLAVLKSANVKGVPTFLYSTNVAQSKVGPPGFNRTLITQDTGKSLSTCHAESVSWCEVVYRRLKSTLAAAFGGGVLHHDISPDNIIVIDDEGEEAKEKDPQPVLIDWGLAGKTGVQSKGWSGKRDFSSLAYDNANFDDGYEYDEKDDLEALIHSISSLHRPLPWQACKSDEEKVARKRRSTPEEVCGDLVFLLDDLRHARDRELPSK